MDGSNSVLLTVVLKHDQSQNLNWIHGRAGRARVVDAVSARWCGDRVVDGGDGSRPDRDAARACRSHQPRQRGAASAAHAGVFSTEFYVSYDFLPVRERHTEEWARGGW